MNIIELAHRICWRYKHSKDPHHSSTYTFNDRTLLQFSEAIREEEGKRLVNACEDARFDDGNGQHIEWYKGFDACAAVLNAERIE